MKKNRIVKSIINQSITRILGGLILLLMILIETKFSLRVINGADLLNMGLLVMAFIIMPYSLEDLKKCLFKRISFYKELFFSEKYDWYVKKKRIYPDSGNALISFLFYNYIIYFILNIYFFYNSFSL